MAGRAGGPGRAAGGPRRVFVCAAGSGGVTALQTFVSAAAKLGPATRTHRRYIAARFTLPLLL